MNNFKNISNKIKAQRQLMHFNQKDLAELTGISERAIRSIENAEASTSITNWYKILDVLGLEMKIVPKQISNEAS
jgi:DNA-binding XRE family transcriptional regulator